MMYRLLQILELAPALIDLLIQIKSQVKSLILLKKCVHTGKCQHIKIIRVTQNIPLIDHLIDRRIKPLYCGS